MCHIVKNVLSVFKVLQLTFFVELDMVFPIHSHARNTYFGKIPEGIGQKKEIRVNRKYSFLCVI